MKMDEIAKRLREMTPEEAARVRVKPLEVPPEWKEPNPEKEGLFQKAMNLPNPREELLTGMTPDE